MLFCQFKAYEKRSSFGKLAFHIYLRTVTVRIDSFEVVAFRDKRVADLDEQVVRLPMETFLKFPWKVNIDSVLINHSRVVVEQVPEKGNTSRCYRLFRCFRIF